MPKKKKKILMTVGEFSLAQVHLYDQCINKQSKYFMSHLYTQQNITQRYIME